MSDPSTSPSQQVRNEINNTLTEDGIVNYELVSPNAPPLPSKYRSPTGIEMKNTWPRISRNTTESPRDGIEMVSLAQNRERTPDSSISNLSSGTWITMNSDESSSSILYNTAHVNPSAPPYPFDDPNVEYFTHINRSDDIDDINDIVSGGGSNANLDSFIINDTHFSAENLSANNYFFPTNVSQVSDMEDMEQGMEEVLSNAI